MFKQSEVYEVIRKSRVTTLTHRGPKNLRNSSVRQETPVRRWNTRELARMANLAQGTVWRIENGYRDARPGTIRKLAQVSGVEPKELVEREE